MRRQRSAVLETPKGRFVEMVFADADPADPASPALTFRVQIGSEAQPYLAEAYLEALRIVRTLIGEEIQSLQRTRDQTG
jgi:hypothetical protein